MLTQFSHQLLPKFIQHTSFYVLLITKSPTEKCYVLDQST